MLFTVNTNKDGYLLSIAHTDHDDIEIDISEFDPRYMNAYRLEEGSVILDQEAKSIIDKEIENESKSDEISELKKNLADSDYIISETFENVLALNNPVTFISDMIKILAQFNSKYATLVANRKQWRDRIEELSK